jgi:4-hydroxyproline epimerase
MKRITVIDSHTGGEPTRVVIDGFPDLGRGSIAERAAIFRKRFDDFRAIVVEEPRGSDILVGALWLPPSDPANLGGVIFFNNVGVLGMCGHGTIGLMVTLKYLGRINPGEYRIETPVGIVNAILHSDGRVSVENVPSYRLPITVFLNVPGFGSVYGDVAWGGNWFFLTGDHEQKLERKNVERLTECAREIRNALKSKGIRGDDGGEIDHIELFGPPKNQANDARNFVLCPGLAYDRSPCGTGTSAKLACLAAAGKLKPGEIWKQESITGSVFEGSYQPGEGNRILPTITGTAFVTAESVLLVDPKDSLQCS